MSVTLPCGGLVAQGPAGVPARQRSYPQADS